MSQRAGRRLTLANIPESQFQHWVDCGFTHIWLMGVWTGGPRATHRARTNRALLELGQSVLPDFTPADLVASPYAISSYTVDSELGGNDALRAFRQKLNARGLGLILDFVPNHVGLDHPWLSEHPGFFVHAASPQPGFSFPATDYCSPTTDCSLPAPPSPFSHPLNSEYCLLNTGHSPFICHGRDPYFLPWTDTAQLEYRSEDARRAILDQLQQVSAVCDGLRCDMAMLILDDVFNRTWKDHPPLHQATPSGEFWSTAIQAVKTERADFLFLAEAYWGLESQLLDLGFDYAYDKPWYDKLLFRDLPALRRHLHTISPTLLARGTRFLENHDEPRIAPLLTHEEHFCAAAHLLCLPGMRLLHEGQLTGARVKVPVQFGRRPHEHTDPRIAEFYTRLLRTLRATRIGDGGFRLLTHIVGPGSHAATDTVFLFLWESPPGSQKSPFATLIAINHGQKPCSVLVDDLPPLHGGSAWAEVLFSDRSCVPRRTGTHPRVELTLAPQSVRIFLSQA